MSIDNEPNSIPSPENTPPPKLYRAFSVHPLEISQEWFQKSLVPGTVSQDDQTKISDGNELGVYMSTNRTMVETAYAHTNLAGNFVETPPFTWNRGRENGINMPVCGVTVEVDTSAVAVRPPKIAPHLQGVYNNGFQGQEWIADEVPVAAFSVKRLILTQGVYDKKALEFHITSPEDIGVAIESLQNAYKKRQAEANVFRDFLEHTDEKVRQNYFILQKMWKAYQIEHGVEIDLP